MPLISLSNKQYQIPHVSGEDIKLGGEKTIFEPRLDMSAFLGESKLSFTPQILSVGETLKGDVLEAENFSLKLLWKATPVLSGFNERGGLDIIITLLTKPDKPYIDFGYDVTRLIPYHQPELTQAEITEGAVRPEHIINSIAWYHDTKGGLVTPSDVSKFITTGKAFHTYRMIASDVLGNKIWTNWTVEKSGIIRLNIDKTWLNKAAYPVTIQPIGDTFGYTSIGGTTGYDIYTNYAVGGQYTGVAGTADSISLYVKNDSSSTKYIKGLLVNQSDLTLVTNGVGNAASMGVYDDGYVLRTSTFATPPTISAVDYIIMFIPSNTCYGTYDVATGIRHVDSTNSYTTPVDLGSTSTTSNRRFAIYCTYTPGGGAIELSVTDGFKIGDSRSESMTASPSVTDGFKSGDSLAGLGNMAVALSDGLKVGDTTLVQAVLSLIDGLVAGDSASESMTANSSLTDGLKLGDSLAALVNMLLSLTDGAKIGDSVTNNMLANPALTDGLKIGADSLPIDVGSAAIDRSNSWTSTPWSMFDTSNPANNTGFIRNIDIWATTDITGLKVFTVYLLSGTTYKTRSSVNIGSVTAGSKQSFPVRLSVVAGDFLACYFTGGSIDLSNYTSSHVMAYPANYSAVGTEGLYAQNSYRQLSLYGTTVASPILQLTANPVLTDGLNIGDTPLSTLLANVSVSDGLKLSDTPVSSLLASVQVTDGLKLGDITLIELVSGGIYYLSVTEGLKIGDSSLISMLANLQLSDGTKLGDSYLAEMTAGLQLSEGIEVGDATVSQLLASLQLSDGVKLGDTPLATMLTGIQLSDGIKLGDLPVSILVSAIELSVTDGFILGDNTSIAFLLAIKLALYLRSRGFTLSPRTRSLTLSPRSESLSLESRIRTLTLALRNRNLTLPERK
jgi:hypothetical protein